MAEPDADLLREWGDLLDGARHDDATSVRGQWPPPLPTALVLAARHSLLGTFHPFTGYERVVVLCGPRGHPAGRHRDWDGP